MYKAFNKVLHIHSDITFDLYQLELISIGDKRMTGWPHIKEVFLDKEEYTS